MKRNLGFEMEFPVKHKIDFCESEIIPQVVKLKEKVI